MPEEKTQLKREQVCSGSDKQLGVQWALVGGVGMGGVDEFRGEHWRRKQRRKLTCLAPFPVSPKTKLPIRVASEPSTPCPPPSSEASSEWSAGAILRGSRDIGRVGPGT